MVVASQFRSCFHAHVLPDSVSARSILNFNQRYMEWCTNTLANWMKRNSCCMRFSLTTEKIQFSFTSKQKQQRDNRKKFFCNQKEFKQFIETWKKERPVSQLKCHCICAQIVETFDRDSIIESVSVCFQSAQKA